MKNYPKALADAQVLAEIIGYLYHEADSADLDAQSYMDSINDAKNNGIEPDGYICGLLKECESKSAAYVRFAEKLAK